MSSLTLMGMLFVATTSLIAAGATWLAVRRRRDGGPLGLAVSIAPIGRELGLTGTEDRATGTVDGHAVVLERIAAPRRTGPGERPVPWIQVRVASGVADLELASERRAGSSGGDVVTGDPAFDRVVWVDGDPIRVLALLDAPTRGMVSGLMRHAVHRDGTWLWSSEGLVPDPDLVRSAVATMIAVTRRWSSLDAPSECLERAVTDPVGGVRERAGEQLILWWERNPDHRRDPDLELLASTVQLRGPAVRLARMRGEAGRDVLERWAATDGDAALDAVLGLAALGIAPGLEARLLAHLPGRDPRVFEALRTVGGPAAVAALEGVVAQGNVWGAAPGPVDSALEAIRARLSSRPSFEEGAPPAPPGPNAEQ